MTARTLSPAEEREATRFGIHDEEAFVEIVEQSDDDLVCGDRTCELPATHRVRCLSCRGHVTVICTLHVIHLQLAGAVLVEHLTCGAVAPARELLEVVPL